jgi:hypothetical protein
VVGVTGGVVVVDSGGADVVEDAVGPEVGAVEAGVVTADVVGAGARSVVAVASSPQAAMTRTNPTTGLRKRRLMAMTLSAPPDYSLEAGDEVALRSLM